MTDGARSGLHFHRNVCHVYSSAAKFMEGEECARFVPHSLMTEQNQKWIALFQDFLSMIQDEN